MGLDLNLLVAFRAIMDTRSVTGAAQQLHLTQPAVSNALQRLRQYFDDDLFVPSGNRMLPTPLADRLAGPVKAILADSTAMLATARPFDPPTADRLFVIAAPDDVTEVVIAPALNRIFDAAPGIRLDIVPLTADHSTPLNSGDVDMHIVPRAFSVPNQPTISLYDDDYVVLGDRDNPALRHGMTGAELRRFHIVGALIVAPRRMTGAHAPQMVARLLDEASVTVKNFSQLPALIAGSERLAVVPRRHAEVMCRHYPLSAYDMAEKGPPLEMVLQLERKRENDAGLQWLAEELVATMRR
ncbi:LysR family transcriptional regulator [Nioella sp.]